MKKTEHSFEAMKKGAFAFLRTVPLDGYHWDNTLQPAPGLVELGEKESLGQPWLVSPPGYEVDTRQYAPFQRPHLFRLFSRVLLNPNAIKRFANKYGWLGHAVPLIYPDVTGQEVQLGESLQFWRQEIEDMALLVKLWELIRYEREDPLSKIILWQKQPLTVRFEWKLSDGKRMSLIASERLANRELLTLWKYNDVIGPARYYLCEQINKRLKGHVNPGILPFLDGEIYMFPDCLRSAMYVLLALEVSGRTQPAIMCRGCGMYFVPKHRHQAYHEEACRKLAYYYRKKSKTDS
jgi:hypothetical protein